MERLKNLCEHVCFMAKDLNMSETYVNDVWEKELETSYKGLKIAVSHSAMQEMMHYSVSLGDVLRVLQDGYDAPRRRKKGTVEKWLDKGAKTFNAVVVKSFDETAGKDCWLLIHFGKFTRK